MKVVKSAWVLPIDAPPIADGAVALDGGTIVAVGTARDILTRWGDRAARERGAGGMIDLGEAVVLPALVNAHTHLELSWMAQAPPPRGRFLEWVRAMITRETPPPERIEEEIGRALSSIAASGVAAVGDVGDTPAALVALRASPLSGRFFFEVIGWEARGATRFDEAARFLDADADAGTAPATFPGSVVPHGPHSVSPEVLARIAARARDRRDIVSVHLAESREEDALLRYGDGPARALLDEMGVLPAGWRPPGLSPVQVLDRAELLGPRTLAVHGVHLTGEDVRLLAARGATVVLCPRSNAWLGVGEAPVAMLLQEGVRLALGTDSHASNEDLDLFAELAALRAIAPGAAASDLLRAATLGGAEALGLSSTLGSITPGKRGPLVALPLVSRRSGGAPGPAAVTGDRPIVEGREAEPYRTVFAGLRPSGLRILGD